jgi:hypothetical protein
MRGNSVMERWIASARRECLDRMLITSERHLRLILGEYTDHYTPIGRTGRCCRTRPPGVGNRPQKGPVCAFCGGTGSAA